MMHTLDCYFKPAAEVVGNSRIRDYQIPVNLCLSIFLLKLFKMPMMHFFYYPPNTVNKSRVANASDHKVLT